MTTSCKSVVRAASEVLKWSAQTFESSANKKGRRVQPVFLTVS